ncbi:MAG: response regulator [Candidatus Eisenbacteria bacterium]|nr:response regulator [Candidatus Eisenbacteria bacterium]
MLEGRDPIAAPSVLVAEENAALLALIVRTLERHGYRPIPACSGGEALRLAGREHPDLILMDMALPLRDGYALARALARDPNTRGIPIIAFQAPEGGGPARRGPGRALRAFDERRLLQQMDRALGGRRVGAGDRAGLWS